MFTGIYYVSVWLFYICMFRKINSLENCVSLVHVPPACSYALLALSTLDNDTF